MVLTYSIVIQTKVCLRAAVVAASAVSSVVTAQEPSERSFAIDFLGYRQLLPVTELDDALRLGWPSQPTFDDEGWRFKGIYADGVAFCIDCHLMRESYDHLYFPPRADRRDF